MGHDKQVQESKKQKGVGGLSGSSFLQTSTFSPHPSSQPTQFLPQSSRSQTRGLKGREREMAEALVARYWCHMCEQVVDPIMGVEIKCPFCESGFVEEMDGREDMEDTDLGSDRALSLWAPILLGLLGGGRPRRQRSRRDDDDENDSDEDREFRALLRRRRRGSGILQFLQSIREDSRPDFDNHESERQRERDRESVILINAFNQAVILQGSSDSDQIQGQDTNGSTRAGVSLGDYFMGPGLDMLLQHLAENDPNRYGTPPAKKEAVDALPTVQIGENMSCSVCLEDFIIGMEAREMPCQHKFHSNCILPWLELHSSCPVCRFQLPADEPKVSNGSGDGSRAEGSNGDGADGSGRGNGSRTWLPVPWPFNELLSLSGSQTDENSSSTSSSSTSGSNSRAHQN